MAADSADSVDQLYAEALRLADAARRYFDGTGCAERATLTAPQRATMTLESLRITTRLIAIVSWGLLQQAVRAGDIDKAAARAAPRRLHPDDSTLPGALPISARSLAIASRDLFARACAADAALPA